MGELGLLLVQVLLAVGSVVYQLTQQKKKTPLQNNAAAEARKGYEMVVEGQPDYLPIVYGRFKLGGVRVWHNTSSDFNYVTSNAEREFLTGIASQSVSGTYTMLEMNSSTGAISESIKTYSYNLSSQLSQSLTGSRNEFLYFQQALCVGPINSIVDIVIDDSRYLDDPALGTYGTVPSSLYYTDANSPEKTKWDNPNKPRSAIRINTFFNTKLGQADNIIAANFSERNSATFTNMAYLSGIFRIDRDDPQFSSVPTLQAFGEGKLVRGITLNAGVYSLNSAYAYSNNSALCLLDYMLLPKVLGGAGYSLSEIDLASFYNSAQVCDTVVQTGAQIGGKIYQPTLSIAPTGSTDYDPSNIYSRYFTTRSIKLYEANLVVDPKRPIRDNVEAFLATMGDARLTWSGGVYKLKISNANIASDASVTSSLAITDDLLILDQEVEINWPSASERYNNCTVKFHNECEDFKEDSVTWPAKIGGISYRGIGGVRPPLADYSYDESNSGGRFLNSYGVWSGTNTSSTSLTYFILVRASDIVNNANSNTFNLEMSGDDSVSLTIYASSDGVTQGAVVLATTTHSSKLTTKKLTVTLGNTSTDSFYKIVVTGTNSAKEKAVAAKLTLGSRIFWTTRDVSYSQYQTINTTAQNLIYQGYLKEDSNIPMDMEIFADGIVDQYHALAKAEELVVTSRTAYTIKFKYLIRDSYLEPGDFFSLQSDTLNIPFTYFRVNNAKVVEENICEIEAQKFTYTQLAWSNKPNEFISTNQNYTTILPAPAYLTYMSNNSNLANSSGTLYWNAIVNPEVTSYIIYMYGAGDPVDANGVPIFTEIGRALNNTNPTSLNVTLNAAFPVNSAYIQLPAGTNTTGIAVGQVITDSTGTTIYGTVLNVSGMVISITPLSTALASGNVIKISGYTLSYSLPQLNVTSAIFAIKSVGLNGRLSNFTFTDTTKSIYFYPVSYSTDNPVSFSLVGSTLSWSAFNVLKNGVLDYAATASSVAYTAGTTVYLYYNPNAVGTKVFSTTDFALTQTYVYLAKYDGSAITTFSDVLPPALTSIKVNSVINSAGASTLSYGNKEPLLEWANNPINLGKNNRVSGYLLKFYIGATWKGSVNISSNSTSYLITQIANATILGALTRQYTVKIFAIDSFGYISATSTDITLNNAIPSTFTYDILSGVNSLYFKITSFPDSDIAGYVIKKTVSGVTTTVYNGTDNYMAVQASPTETATYAVYAYDQFNNSELTQGTTTSVATVSTADATQWGKTGIDFSYDGTTNIVSWTAGVVYANATSYNVSAGSTTAITTKTFIYFDKSATPVGGLLPLKTSTLLSDAVTAGRWCLASYSSTEKLKGGDGSAFISGSQVVAGSIGAGQLTVDSAVITNSLQLANGVVGNLAIGNEIYSNNYSSVSRKGWRLDKNGDIKSYGTLEVLSPYAGTTPNYILTEAFDTSKTVTLLGDSVNLIPKFRNMPIVTAEPWEANTEGVVSTLYYYGYYTYNCSVAGTFGATPPTHITGTVVNGTASLAYSDVFSPNMIEWSAGATGILNAVYYYDLLAFRCTVAGTFGTTPPTATGANGTATLTALTTGNLTQNWTASGTVVIKGSDLVGGTDEVIVIDSLNGANQTTSNLNLSDYTSYDLSFTAYTDNVSPTRAVTWSSPDASVTFPAGTITATNTPQSFTMTVNTTTASTIANLRFLGAIRTFAKAAAYTVLTTDDNSLFTYATASGYIMTLPAVSTVATNFTIYISVTGAGTQTVKPSGTDILVYNGTNYTNAAPLTLATGKKIKLIRSGTQWLASDGAAGTNNLYVSNIKLTPKTPSVLPINSLYKNKTTTVFDSKGYSVESYQDRCALRFKFPVNIATGTGCLIGLNDTPRVTNDDSVIPYAIQNLAGVAVIYEKGVAVYTSTIAITSSTLFEIEYDKTLIKYKYSLDDGATWSIFYTSISKRNMTYFVDSSFGSAKSMISNIQFSTYELASVVQDNNEVLYVDGDYTLANNTPNVALVNRSMVLKGVGNYAWDRGSYTLTNAGLGNAGFKFTPYRDDKEFAVGLTTLSNNSYTLSDLQYGIHFTKLGTFDILNQSYSGTYTEDDAFEIRYYQNSISYLQNGRVLLTQTNIDPTNLNPLAFKLKVCLYSPGSGVAQIKIGSYTVGVPDFGARTEILSDVIKVYDKNNVVRIKLGDLST